MLAPAQRSNILDQITTADLLQMLEFAVVWEEVREPQLL